ncbi:type-F conjugative transfer system protein TraW [Salmonella enterica]|nr:type-F conjugative transfer system protein TraW [Salmonella enterica]EBM0715714.1 type-F conjugative transfer system protein TraW [Salmonella enterica subsp. enterica serovar Agona]EBW8697257.1 type-F conjugative transfer system protein TraW [Salmonella enterica subsp. diarizonae serovar 16:z10:e,n,x,z15]EAO2846490.1 type-F conjugative transfer system protein TraW [Salmonella enterica]EAP9533283.1 type-F conjugative transfer system protein TraW [Salmonella enterica]
MNKQPMLIALVLLALSASSGAKDLGTWGNVFEPAEQDMLDFIQNRLKGMEQNGELDRLRREAVERVKRNAVRPPAVGGLSHAVKYRSFVFDPTFTVQETVTDLQGNIIARKGDKVNPLDKVPFNQVLYFIDGDDKAQMDWARKEITGQTNIKVILVKGNIKDTSDALNERIYFDQAGVLTRKFGFSSIPVRVSRDGRVLKVEEIPVSGVKNDSNNVR